MSKTTEALRLAEALENDAKEHREVSYGLDCPPERTANWKHALNCEAAARLIREALAEPVKQEPASNKYNHKRVGWELERTAMGDSYYGNALYSAMDLHFLNKREKDCLHRYMHGSETPNDRFVLQDIANKVYFEPEAEPVKQEPVAVISESAIGLVKLHSNGACLPFGTQLYAAPVEPVKQEPVAWHEPNAYGNVTTHKKWAEENGWLPLYTKE